MGKRLKMSVIATIDSIGITRYVMEYGMPHRSNGPALHRNIKEWGYNGSRWYLYGKIHRYYGPAWHASTYWVIHGLRIG